MKSCRLLLIPILILLSACGTLSRPGGYYEDDGPEDRPPVNVAAIPDAVPRAEPLATSGNKPYTVYGTIYTPMLQVREYRERGTASWYGKKFHGKRTASGEAYDMYAMTAAHKTLPLPSYVRVRNLNNDRTVVVRINDRGPFLHNRLIDLSYAAAAKLGLLGTGTAPVEIEAIQSPDDGQVVKTFPLQVIAPAGAAEKLPVPETPPETPKFYLQVGAFTSMENADALRRRLEQEALSPIFIQTAQGPAQGGTTSTPIFRVRIGPLASAEDGDRLIERLTQLGVPNSRLVVE